MNFDRRSDEIAQARLDERRKVLAEVKALVEDFSWTLPLYEGKEVNVASDDAACSVVDQIKTAIGRLPGN